MSGSILISPYRMTFFHSIGLTRAMSTQKVEQLHVLDRAVYYGQRGRISAREVYDQMNACSCLTLILACTGLPSNLDSAVDQLKARPSDAVDRFLEGIPDNRQVASDDNGVAAQNRPGRDSRPGPRGKPRRAASLARRAQPLDPAGRSAHRGRERPRVQCPLLSAIGVRRRNLRAGEPSRAARSCSLDICRLCHRYSRRRIFDAHRQVVRPDRPGI